MSDWVSRPEVRLAALKRERDAVATKPYADAALKERRLSEIDAELEALGEKPAAVEAAPVSRRGARERAVAED